MEAIGLYEAMRTLRAVRRLRADPIPDGVLYRILEAATWAPTGSNTQPWRIIVVKDPERKERLRSLYRKIWSIFVEQYSGGLADLPEDIREKYERMISAGDYLAEHFHECPVIVVFCFNPTEIAITDEALERISVVGGASIYPAVENLLLACRAEGLGCTLTTLLCTYEDEVREILNIPEPWGTAAAIPIGYPMLRGHGPISRRSVKELTFAESWGETYQ
jgi:nitroreductase